MEISESLKETIKLKRQQLKYTLARVSLLSGTKKSGKPFLSSSTLSAIEKGKLTGIKTETYEKLREILNLDVEQENGEQNKIKCAFGRCYWASPIINTLVKDTLEGTDSNEPLMINKIQFFGLNGREKSLKPIKTYNQEIDEGVDSFFTANEILPFLDEGKIDIAFLPVKTTEKIPGTMRLARIMNTIKGGVLVYVLCKDTEYSVLEEKTDEDIINMLAKPDIDHNDYQIVYPKDSIAQFVVEEYFSEIGITSFAVTSFTIQEFKDKVIKQIEDFFFTSKNFDSSNKKYFIFVGWDILVDHFKKEIERKKSEDNATLQYSSIKDYILEAYYFANKNAPFITMSYDCVTVTKKFDDLIKHEGLKELFKILIRNIAELERIKKLEEKKILKEKNNAGDDSNPRYRLINKYLNISNNKVKGDLKKINWEFLLYPEMYSKELI